MNEQIMERKKNTEFAAVVSCQRFDRTSRTVYMRDHQHYAGMSIKLTMKAI